MEFPLVMHRWNAAKVLDSGPRYPFISQDMIMDQQYGIVWPHATLLEKNKYCINYLQHMATSCEVDK